MNLCGKTSIVELGSILQEMSFVVSVDSGPMHMAAALDIPVIAVFGPTDPVQVGPYGMQHRVVKQGADIGCLPIEPVIDACLSKLGAGR